VGEWGEISHRRPWRVGSRCVCGVGGRTGVAHAARSHEDGVTARLSLVFTNSLTILPLSVPTGGHPCVGSGDAAPDPHL
jgi:hypothetical protein